MIDEAKLALQALEDTMDRFCMADWDDTKVSEAITALRAAIEAAERQVPVAEICVAKGSWVYTKSGNAKHLSDGFHKLYAHPPAITDDRG